MRTKIYQKVDLRSKNDMVEFLTNHFRYDTMSSWNASTSYANKVKVYNCIPSELQDKVFELMEAEGFYYGLNDLLEQWGELNEWGYQAAFNGRSGGYIVMYEGGYNYKTLFAFDRPNNDRDYQDGYGWMDIKEAKERGLYKKQIKKVFCSPGRSIDMDEDFEEWNMPQLKKRVKLIQSFDSLCDEIIEEVIYMAENTEVEEEIYTIEKTRKVLV